MTRRAAALFLALALAGGPSRSAAQQEGPSKTSGFVTGALVGTASGSLALAGFCAGRVIADDDLEVWDCLSFGAMVSAAPALATGYGLTYPDRTSWAGRLRTVALGTLGGSLEGLLLSLVSEVEEPRDLVLWGAAWGTGIGLVSTTLGPAVQARLFPSARRSGDGSTDVGLRYVFQ